MTEILRPSYGPLPKASPPGVDVDGFPLRLHLISRTNGTLGWDFQGYDCFKDMLKLELVRYNSEETFTLDDVLANELNEYLRNQTQIAVKNIPGGKTRGKKLKKLSKRT